MKANKLLWLLVGLALLVGVGGTAKAEDNATCAGFSEPVVASLPGGGECTLLGFTPDGFSPGPAGTARLECVLDGVWGHYMVPASCVADKYYLAGFPCEPTSDGLTCFLVDVSKFHCYEFHGHSYCFREPVEVVEFRSAE